ncbi:MAG: PadR family transcriptional regulator [Firmicutes bacterium]|nr:PadR family transcriptional regulator [Bacillota bacterium]
MAREKLQTLTEQMFYTLLCLYEEGCGADIMKRTEELTGGRVKVGSGTLYNLIEQFLESGMIRETGVDGRKRSYILTDKGIETLEAEYGRMICLLRDFEKLNVRKRGEEKCQEKDSTLNISFPIGACLTTEV